MRPRTAIFLLCAFVIIMATGEAVAEQSEYLTYEEFITALKQDRVKSVQLDRFSRISGVYIEGESEKNFNTYCKVGGSNDPLLMELLREKGVAIDIKKQKERLWPMPIVGLFMFAIPIVTLVYVVKINGKLKRLKPTERESTIGLGGTTEI